MGAPKITEIAEHLNEWDFLQKLPEEIDGFKKVPGTGIEGQILHIVSYVNEAEHRSVDLTYTAETFDYVPVKTIGLHVFRDERYFCRDQQRFGEMMLEHLPDLLKEISSSHKMKYSYAAKDVQFEKWDFWKTLPKRIGDFELYITPDNPVNYINGSCIFLDYSDFEHKSQLYFLFNNFRIEVFGEMLQRNIPVTISTYTVPEENEQGQRKAIDPTHILPKFSELLKQHLEADIEKLAQGSFETI